MTQMIFVNLPVADLDRAKAFYTAIGFVNDPRFTDEKAASMRLSETIHVMLLTHAFFDTFSSRTRIDPQREIQALLCLSRESRAAVDAIVADATAAGGEADPGPKQDLGFMYGRSFACPDGHIWETVWMDPAAVAEGPPPSAP